jgi:hypothetical protein
MQWTLGIALAPPFGPPPPSAMSAAVKSSGNAFASHVRRGVSLQKRF